MHAAHLHRQMPMGLARGFGALDPEGEQAWIRFSQPSIGSVSHAVVVVKLAMLCRCTVTADCLRVFMIGG